MIFKGSIPAVITPFDRNHNIDFDSLEKHIKFLIDEGSHGLVSCGTTGESPTLDHDEHKKVTEFIVKKSNSRVPVMAGCGSNSTSETLDLVDHAKKSKADAALLVTPYYNKPSEDGLFKHYKFISEKIDLPVYLYDIPGRSIVRLSINLIEKLSKIKNIVGIKDATSDLSSPMEVRRICGKNFVQLSGEDATFLAFLMNGGTGCISVTANVVPKISSQIYESWKNKDFVRCMELNHLLYPLNKALFLQSSPCPVKYALSKMNKCFNILRLPLTPVNEDTMNEIDLVLKHLNLIK